MIDDPGKPRRWMGLPRIVWGAMCVALIASAACYAAAGPTLGLFFGGMVFACLLMPPLSLIGRALAHRLLIAAAVCDGIALVWIATLFNSPVTFVQLLLCYALLIGSCAALVGMTCAISRLASLPHLARREHTPGDPRCEHRGLNEVSDDSTADVVAAAIVVSLGLLWLTCPIWLPASTGTRIDGLLAVHPLFAINGVLNDLGLWTQQPLAYRYLFTLGQDVPYTLPRSILPCAGVHLLLGLAALGLAGVRGRR